MATPAPPVISRKPMISVALCTCNGARYVAEQISSICTQQRPVQEIVLFDDVSDDNTVEVAEAAWLQADPRTRPVLRVHRQERRQGVTGNFASALAACHGEVIALCDQDDRWHPERIAVLLERLARQPRTLLLHGNARLVDASGASLGQTLFDALAVRPAELRAIGSGRAFDVFLDRNLVTGATTLLRRTLLEAALPIPPGWLHDEWLGVVGAALGAVDVELAALIDYRQHGANQVGARRENLQEMLRRLCTTRGDWHLRRVERARSLCERIAALGPAAQPGALAAARDKLDHHVVRAAFPAARVRRLIPVLREWRSGRYLRYGRGVRGAAKDLFESS